MGRGLENDIVVLRTYLSGLTISYSSWYTSHHHVAQKCHELMGKFW